MDWEGRERGRARGGVGEGGQRGGEGGRGRKGGEGEKGGEGGEEGGSSERWWRERCGGGL